MKRGKNRPGGPAPSKKQQLAKQRLSTHDPARAKKSATVATAKLKKQLRKAQRTQGQSQGLEQAADLMQLDPK